MPDTPTTRLSLYKSASDGSEDVNYTQDIGQNLDKLDAAVGFQACTSSTRPSSPYSGKPIMESDTTYRTYLSNGTLPASASWIEIPNSSATYNNNLKLATGKQINIGASASPANIAILAASTADDIISTRISGDTQSRYLVEADGATYWGTGTTAADVTLSRTSTSTLTLTGNLTVTGSINSASNLNMGAWTTWTPTWTTTSGSATPSYGNASVDCKYARIGRTIIFRLDIVFGSTTNFGTSPTTGDNWLFSLPVTPAAATNSTICTVALRQSNTAALTARARIASTGTDVIISIAGGRVDATAVTNTGDVDSLSPWTWANGNEIHAVGQYEAAS
ncbi:hypothetical protein [Streptomyces antibioticus]|uniref:hypothetical protein n=1 Tax=Streptomyces antibioticus TaxID=1890 RepID=UPI0033E6FDB0